MSKVKIPNYSLGEELINSISHGVGAALSIAALVLLVIKCKTSIGVVSSAIYGSCMILLYLISCIYHALSPKLLGKKVLRVIDHCNVFLLEAGTFTPICLAIIGGKLGWIVFGLVWGITTLCIVLNAIDVDKYIVSSVICNLLIGWSVLIIYKPLTIVLPINGIRLLIWGGIAYSVGAILYRIGAKRKYMHSIFHFFVLLGSILHFFMIYLYI